MKRFFQALLMVLLMTGGAHAAQVGVVLTGDIPYYQEINRAFTNGLRKEGVKAELLVQTPAPDPVAWSNSARKMAAAGVDVIVVYGAPAADAVVRETSGIPVVFAAVPDPKALGIGGKNVTGMSSRMQLAGIVKNLRSMKDFQTLGIVYNSSEKDTVAQMEEIARLEGQFGFKSVKLNIRGRAEADRIKGVDALFITTSCVANQCITSIAKAARALGVPTATTVSGGENAGIILTVSPSAEEQGEVAAEMAAKILKGAEPSSIKVEQPRKIDVVINLREANAMGIKVPMDLLSTATQVIK